jgi:hypothetical protein
MSSQWEKSLGRQSLEIIKIAIKLAFALLRICSMITFCFVLVGFKQEERWT